MRPLCIPPFAGSRRSTALAANTLRTDPNLLFLCGFGGVIWSQALRVIAVSALVTLQQLLCSLMLPPTDMTELAAATTPVFQLVLQRALVLLQTKLVEGLTTDLAIHKLYVATTGTEKANYPGCYRDRGQDS